MKRINIVGFIFMLMMFTIGCEELPDPAGERNVAIVPDITDLNPGVFDINDLENSYVRFTVTIPEGTSVSSITLICSYNNDHSDIAITEITTFPAVMTVTSAEVAQKMGISLDDIERGDIFDFELLITTNGRITRSTPLVIPVACVYSVNMATGSYHSFSPAYPAGWETEGDITLTADDDDIYMIYVSGLEVLDGNVEDLGPLVMHVDPITYAVTVPKKALASDVWGVYHNIAYEGTGTFSSCDGTYNMNFTITVDEGSFGAFPFTFTRND